MTEVLNPLELDEKLRQITPELGDDPALKDILKFAHNAFEHDGLNTPESLDPFTVLAQAKAGEKMPTRLPTKS